MNRSQFGFRKGCGTHEAMYGLIIMAERYMDVQKELHTRFDRIQHVKLVEILERVDLDGRDITIIRKQNRKRAYS